MSSKSEEQTVLVTVGTTKFEDLIKYVVEICWQHLLLFDNYSVAMPEICTCFRAVDNLEFADALRKKGYARLVIQKGAGIYVPTNLVPSGHTAKLGNGLTVE